MPDALGLLVVEGRALDLAQPHQAGVPGLLLRVQGSGSIAGSTLRGRGKRSSSSA
ncbi:MAG TPA: hypothetical protein P5164_11360 [Thermoanaerobaculia bacterium]|nr:hypothetical protein [Thermoanaerobaculia bacterium]